MSAGSQHSCMQREREVTAEFKKRYAARAGIEGTFSQADRVVGLRRTRYIGLAKTHLQHVVTAAATTVLRLVAWFESCPALLFLRLRKLEYQHRSATWQ